MSEEHKKILILLLGIVIVSIIFMKIKADEHLEEKSVQQKTTEYIQDIQNKITNLF